MLALVLLRIAKPALLLQASEASHQDSGSGAFRRPPCCSIHHAHRSNGLTPQDRVAPLLSAWASKCKRAFCKSTLPPLIQWDQCDGCVLSGSGSTCADVDTLHNPPTRKIEIIFKAETSPFGLGKVNTLQHFSLERMIGKYGLLLARFHFKPRAH